MPDQMERFGALAHTCTCVLKLIFCRSHFVVQYILIGGLAIATATAQETTTFDIDAGPAAQSLNQYARQAGVDLGFPMEVIGGTHTNEVKGNYHPDEALALLLKGTGLVATRDEKGLAISQATMPDRTPNGELRDTHKTVSQRRVSANQVANDEASTTEDTRAKKAAGPLEEILVTGSRIRGAQNASPVVTIKREEIDRTGYSTVGELVESLPQNFGAGATQDSLTNRGAGSAVGGAVDNITAGQSVNLRGLGTGSTLVLLNGRRMSPSGLSARFTDVSRIPLSAVERVDVLTDGASAIYGSDAIAGVINFVLRDNYDGAETRIKHGSDTSGDIAETMISQAFGNTWSNGSALASFEYYQRDSLPNIARKFSASADLTTPGGTDWRGLGGNPANIVADGQTYAIPHDQNGMSLTPNDFVLGAAPNMHDFRAAEDLFPRQQRHNVFLYLMQEFGQVELFAPALLSRREANTDSTNRCAVSMCQKRIRSLLIRRPADCRRFTSATIHLSMISGRS
jgi:hypothetical protein